MIFGTEKPASWKKEIKYRDAYATSGPRELTLGLSMM